MTGIVAAGGAGQQFLPSSDLQSVLRRDPGVPAGWEQRECLGKHCEYRPRPWLDIKKRGPGTLPGGYG